MSRGSTYFTSYTTLPACLPNARTPAPPSARKLFVPHRQHDGVVRARLRGRDGRQAVFVMRLGGIHPWVEHFHLGVVALQRLHDVDHARIAQVGAGFP